MTEKRNEVDKYIQDSRLAPSGDGHYSSPPQTNSPTSGQKWWISILLGIVFALLCNPIAYAITNLMTTGLGGLPTIVGLGPTIAGVLIHTLLFVLVVRIIIW
jgi:hypothetical protein